MGRRKKYEKVNNKQVKSVEEAAERLEINANQLVEVKISAGTLKMK